MPHLAESALLLLFGAGVSSAAAWQPERNVELVVPAGPGGGLDTMARALQRVFQDEKLLTVPVTVVNKPGGSGTLGLAYIDQHPGDGRFLSVESPVLVTDGITGMGTIGLKDVSPVALLLREEIFFSVPAASAIASGADLIARLRHDPQSVSISVSSAPGGHSHAAAALVMKAIGGDPARLKMVFFGSGGEATAALLGGHVDVAVTPVSNVLRYREAGQVRIIAVPAALRLPGALADVPTWREQGADVVFAAWRGVVGPRRMTEAQLAYWDGIFAGVTRSQEWKDYAQRNFWTTDYKDSRAVTAFWTEEEGRLRPILTELGLAR